MNLVEIEAASIKSRFEVKKPQEKITQKIKPYLSIALTKSCTLNCFYCGEGGELTKSKQYSHNIKVLFSSVQIAKKLGIDKIRVTGGEPFTYPHIEDLIRYLQETNLYILVNTNSTILIRETFIQGLKDNVHFVVHLETLQENKYNAITSSQNKFRNVIRNIELLSHYKRLLRLNIVLLPLNEDEIFDLIGYCSKLGINLKIFDITKVPNQYKNKETIYIPLWSVEQRIQKEAERMHLHEYAKSFGTPCNIYKVNGVLVTCKSVIYGSRFDREIYCKDCPYFPCDEGLYDILYYPDGKLWGCRWFDKNMQRGTFEEELRFLIKVFQRSDWYVNGQKVYS